MTTDLQPYVPRKGSTLGPYRVRGYRKDTDTVVAECVDRKLWGVSGDQLVRFSLRAWASLPYHANRGLAPQAI